MDAMKITVIFINSFIVLVGFALCHGQGVAMATVTTIPSDGAITVDSSEEYLNCSKQPESSEGNSEGDQEVPCLQGQRRGSTENPCPQEQRCCSCDRGSYQSYENNYVCDTCRNHTVCDEYESHGSYVRDAVCKSKVTDVSTEVQLPSEPTARTKEENYTGSSMRPSTSTTTDNSQDSKFSILWPWSIVATINQAVLVLLLIGLLAFIIFRWHRKRNRKYNEAPQDDSTGEGLSEEDNL